VVEVIERNDHIVAIHQSLDQLAGNNIDSSIRDRRRRTKRRSPDSPRRKHSDSPKKMKSQSPRRNDSHDRKPKSPNRD
jgi:hypothetical protein